MTSVKRDENDSVIGEVYDPINDGPIGRPRTTDPALATNTSLAPMPTEGYKLRRKDDSIPVVTDYIDRDEDGSAVAVAPVVERAATKYAAYTLTCLPSSGTIYPGDAVRLVGLDTTRRKLRITNAHPTDSVLIGPLESIVNGAGFLLPPTTMIDPEIQGEVYAAVPPTGLNAIQVGIWVEMS